LKPHQNKHLAVPAQGPTYSCISPSPLATGGSELVLRVARYTRRHDVVVFFCQFTVVVVCCCCFFGGGGGQILFRTHARRTIREIEEARGGGGCGCVSLTILFQ